LVGSKHLSVALVAIILLGAGFIGPWMISAQTVSGPKVSRATTEASVETIGSAGVGPTTVSLYWTESTDLTFTSYALRESAIGDTGPWIVIANIYDRTSTAYYFDELTPGATEWWEMQYHNATGSRETIPALQIMQPSVASLTVFQPSSTSAQLTWDNKAVYGGLLSFASYQLIESANGGVDSVTTTITDVAQRGYTASDLTPSTTYAFYLNTTDQCNSCAAGSPSTTSSNVVSIQTPGPLTSAIIAPSSPVEVGELASFTCAAGGGAPPYTYSWSFGDGTTGAVASLSHTFDTPGSTTVICRVTDTLGTTVKDSAEVDVGLDPSITSFTASPVTLYAGEKVTFSVFASGGYGALAYSYTNLPAGCLSINATTLSCYPTSSGNYRVTVTATDRSGESATGTVSITVGPERVLGLPQAIGLAVIFGAIVGIGAIAILSVALGLRWKKRGQARTATRGSAWTLLPPFFEH